MAAAIVAIPTEATAATRTPPSRTGIGQRAARRAKRRWQGRHPHPEGRVGDAGVDPLEAEDRVLDDRQERIDHERGERRGLADPAAEGDQEDAEEREAGDRLEDVGQADDRPLGAASTGSPGSRAGRRWPGGDDQGLADEVDDGRRSPGTPRLAGPRPGRRSRAGLPGPRTRRGASRSQDVQGEDSRPIGVTASASRKKDRTKSLAGSIRGTRPEARQAGRRRPLVDEGQSVGHPAGLAEVVSDEDHGLAEVAAGGRGTRPGSRGG